MYRRKFAISYVDKYYSFTLECVIAIVNPTLSLMDLIHETITACHHPWTNMAGRGGRCSPAQGSQGRKGKSTNQVTTAGVAE